MGVVRSLASSGDGRRLASTTMLEADVGVRDRDLAAVATVAERRGSRAERTDDAVDVRSAQFDAHAPADRQFETDVGRVGDQTGHSAPGHRADQLIDPGKDLGQRRGAGPTAERSVAADAASRVSFQSGTKLGGNA